MINENDPRLAIDNTFLSEFTWENKRWTQTRENWDHDHCEFCGAKLMDIDSSDVLREGFTTPDEYYWICKTCFEDFREKFNWKETAA